jgi:predicted nucleic acid-binding protein
MTFGVIDSGTLITVSSTCLINVFKKFVKHNKLELVVSSEVTEESVWKPIHNKRFALNAARIKFLFNSDTIEVIAPTKEIRFVEKKILDLANSAFSTSFGPITIIQNGEAEALAIAKINNAEILFVDERTTRSLLENPLRLKQVLEKRQHKKIRMNEEKVHELQKMFANLKIFRSIDVIAFAYEQGLFEGELDSGKLELEAALYAAKFAGCAVSEREIVEYLKLK